MCYKRLAYLSIKHRWIDCGKAIWVNGGKVLIKVRFNVPDGSTVIAEGKDDESVMHVAVANGVPGIVGECGGVLVCATCHVYVDDDWAEKIPPRTSDEDDMLECATAERQPTSRLCCQLRLSPELDGIVVTVPVE